jgi:glucokinase
VEDRELLASSSIMVQGNPGLGSLLPHIADQLNQLLRNRGTRASDCRGIAAGFPGLVETRTGRICSPLAGKYEDATDVDLPAWAQAEFGLLLRVENDARMAVLGERYEGAASDVSDVVMVTLGTGIGTGVILRGRLVRGAHAQAGCLGGHFTVKFDGRPCLCGNVGCAETEASGWALPGLARSRAGFSQSALVGEVDLGFRELIAHAQHGDPVAAEVWDHCLRVWSANAVTLVHAYDPAVLLLGGGVMETSASIVPFIQNYINQHTWAGSKKPEVRKASLGTAAAFLGAIPLLTEDVDDMAL